MEDQLKNLRQIMDKTVLRNVEFDERNKQDVWRTIREQNGNRPLLREKRWLKQGLAIITGVCFCAAFTLFTVNQIDTPIDNYSKGNTPDERVSPEAELPENETDKDTSENSHPIDRPMVIGLDQAKKVIPFKIELPPEPTIPEDLRHEAVTTAETYGNRGIVKTMYGKRGGEHIEITQANTSEKSDEIYSVSYEQIEINGVDAWVFSDSEGMWSRILLWRDGMNFEFQAVDVPLEKMIEVAETMEPLPYYKQIADIGENLKKELDKRNTKATVAATEKGTVELQLSGNHDFTYYVDIDQDSYLTSETTVTTDNVPYATVGLIVDSASDYYETNLRKGKEIGNRLGAIHPQLFRGISIEKNREHYEYNEKLYGASILIEIGGAESRPEDIERTVKLLAQAIADVEATGLY